MSGISEQLLKKEICQAATLKSSCIVMFAHLLKIHPAESIEIHFN